MSTGIGTFNKAASNAYGFLSTQERERLQEKAEKIEKSTTFTSADIRHRASTVFKKIRNQVVINLLVTFNYNASSLGSWKSMATLL